MKPIIHARLSAKKYGGTPECYLPIHEFLDSSKAALADVRHRAILHSAFGCFVVERVFGPSAVNSEGKDYCPRDVAEDHILEDLGQIPTLEKWLSKLPLEAWMGRPNADAAKDKVPTVTPTRDVTIDGVSSPFKGLFDHLNQLPQNQSMTRD